MLYIIYICSFIYIYVYIAYFEYNLKDTYCRHICYSWYVNNMSNTD